VAVLGERQSAGSLIGLIASAVGVASVVLAGVGGVGVTPQSDGLFLLGAASCAVYVIGARRAFAGGDLFATLAGMTRCGVLFLLPAAGVELATVGIGVPDPGSVLLVIFLGAGCSALAFGLSAFGARHLKAGQCSVILNVEVPIGVAAGVILFQEPFAAGQVLGGLLIVAGAILILAPARPRRPAAATRSPALAVEGV
jgi:drug/metabolite transporter (DMT)-like permease